MLKKKACIQICYYHWLKEIQQMLPWYINISTYVTLDHKSSHKGQFFEIEIYTSSESCIDNISIGGFLLNVSQNHHN